MHWEANRLKVNRLKTNHPNRVNSLSSKFTTSSVTRRFFDCVRLPRIRGDSRWFEVNKLSIRGEIAEEKSKWQLNYDQEAELLMRPELCTNKLRAQARAQRWEHRGQGTNGRHKQHQKKHQVRRPHLIQFDTIKPPARSSIQSDSLTRAHHRQTCRTQSYESGYES